MDKNTLKSYIKNKMSYILDKMSRQGYYVVTNTKGGTRL